MKYQLGVAALMLQGIMAAQTPCGSSVTPCSIAATVNESGVTLNDSTQSFVAVPLNTTITWKVNGGSDYFLVIFHYIGTGSIFGSASNIFFKGDATHPVTAKVTAESNGAVEYLICAFDSNGTPHVLDPKVITNSHGASIRQAGH